MTDATANPNGHEELAAGLRATGSAPSPDLYSDDALALRFAERHAHSLRYVAAWNQWFVWTGMRWERDSTLRAFDLARVTCRTAADEITGTARTKIAPTIKSAKTVASVERLAKADQRIAATVDLWDADPWLLNTPRGAVDLRTGTTRPNRPEDHCTKITAVAPGGDCPLWRAFLNRITDGNVALQEFLQRLCGYALTGVTYEHTLVFLYGTGGNGKGVFTGTVMGVLGDYATTAPIETFMASHGDRHPTDLADLRGARLVTAIETEEGRYWAEAKIKALTGGDRIKARFMRQDFFEFTPQLKLLIAGNHKPHLNNVDEAIRRRLNLVPFTVTIPEGERDELLPERLKAEWPGILRWMIDGCRAWQAEGLSPPTAVRETTEDYLAEEDSVALWLGERTRPDAMGFETTADLFADWKTWAERARERVGSEKRFSQTLSARGHTKKRQPGTGKAGFAGLALVRPDYSDAHWNR